MALKYFAFGLKITSEIEFPEMKAASFVDDEDVTIQIGITPDQLSGADTVIHVFNQARPGEYLLEIRNVARYYVCNGDQIIIQPAPGADMASVRLFLLSSAIAAILHQKRITPLHASAVLHSGKVVLLCGHSGMGKSTSAAHLHLRGYPLFSDDVCVIQNHTSGNDEVYAHSSYPMCRLWKDAIDHLNHEAFQGVYPLRHKINKFGSFFWDSYEVEARKIDKVLVLQKAAQPSQGLETRRHTRMDAINLLRNQVFRRAQLDGLGGKKELFLTLSKIAQKIPVISIIRPLNHENIDKFIDLLEDVILEGTAIPV